VRAVGRSNRVVVNEFNYRSIADFHSTEAPSAASASTSSTPSVASGSDALVTLSMGGTENVFSYFMKIYTVMLEALEERYSNKMIASQRILLLLTNLDMIPQAYRNKFRHWIISQFSLMGVPENFILCAEKECEWDECQLSEHDAKVDQFLHSVPADENYWDHFKKEDGHSSWLHYDRSWCLNDLQGCQHNFTESTTKAYAQFLTSTLGQ
jgi:hypothetical protein